MPETTTLSPTSKTCDGRRCGFRPGRDSSPCASRGTPSPRSREQPSAWLHGPGRPHRGESESRFSARRRPPSPGCAAKSGSRCCCGPTRTPRSIGWPGRCCRSGYRRAWNSRSTSTRPRWPDDESIRCGRNPWNRVRLESASAPVTEGNPKHGFARNPHLARSPPQAEGKARRRGGRRRPQAVRRHGRDHVRIARRRPRRAPGRRAPEHHRHGRRAEAEGGRGHRAVRARAPFSGTNPRAFRLRTPCMTAGVAALRPPGYRTQAMLLAALLGVVGRAEADQPLLRRVAAGDSRALRTLYDHHAAAALAVAFRILRAKSEAEDVVQEAFVEVWRRAASFDPRRGSASSFVLAVCRSRALDRLRSRGSAERAVAASAREEPEPSPLPIESAVQRQDRERVQRALAALPAEQRGAIELPYFAGP